MAITDDEKIAARVRDQTQAEPLQTTGELIKRFVTGIAARSLVSPKGFAWWGWPLGAALSFVSDADLSKYFWERIRPLETFPRSYNRRFSNVQSILGLRALSKLDDFNERSQAHADVYTNGLAKCAAIETPRVIDDAEHVYYQYCVYVSEPKVAKRRAIRRGVDFETTHVDVCPALTLFKDFAASCPGADQTAKALQLPVYSRLRTSDVERVLSVVKEVAADLAPLERNAPRKELAVPARLS